MAADWVDHVTQANAARMNDIETRLDAKTTSFNTVAALKAATSAVSPAQVLGYYAPGDGGGGWFRWDATDTTSADNGGTILVSTGGLSGRWKRIYTGNEVNTGWFGILPSLTTDVSTALGTIVAGLADGSVLQLGPGTYLVPSLRNVSVNNIVIRGVPGKTRLLGNGSLASTLFGSPGAQSDVMFKVKPGAGLRVEDVIVEDAGILIGFEDLGEIQDIDIVRCSFISCGGVALAVNTTASFLTGMALSKLYAFRNFRMIDCNVTDCELGAAPWVYGGWESATVSGCNFKNAGMLGVWIGSEGVVSGSVARDPDVYQPLQASVHVYDNTFRHIRPTLYATSVDVETVNAIAAWGQAVSIHNNYIEDLDNVDKWDDCEGIYVKARYFDIHDNTLIDAGGAEAAIVMKGGNWEASTTLHSSMNGLTLPRSSITVVSTHGFPGSNSEGGQVRNGLIQTSAGWKAISWTGKTATTLTGVTGGTGTLATGGVVRGSVHQDGYLEGQAYPGKCHDNTIVFTKTDRQYKGIISGVQGVSIEGNIFRGCTGTVVAQFYWCADGIIDNNFILDHHGESVFAISGSGWVARNNHVVNFDGSYNPSAPALYVFEIFAEDNTTVTGIDISGNHVRNRLADDGTLSAASAKTTVVRLHGVTSGGVLDRVNVSRNTARNVLAGLVVSGSVTTTNLSDIDNDWQNDVTTQPSTDTSAATSVFRRSYTDLASKLAASSGSQVALTVAPTINQSGTAGYTVLGLDVTQSATGSGTNRLIDAKVGGVTQFSVANDGRTFIPYFDLANGDCTVERFAPGMMSIEGLPVVIDVAVPATPTSAGVKGQRAADATGEYVCVATNTWRKATLGTW